ncbi:hypothetical protein PM082_011878 [Marasmius tenuissimus]|nr:hypothetical protein PM082_011878 [Marasmius tenuissimus]
MDLSTIIEADTSGISKHLPSTSNSASSSPPSSRFPSQSPSPSPFSPPSIDRDNDPNDSSHLELELSTSQITSQVANDWLKDANARVVDVDPDDSLILDDEPEFPAASHTLVFDLDTVDPTLAALLSPHKIPPGPGNSDNENETIVIPKPLRPPPSPLLSPYHLDSTIVKDHHSHRPQQQSSLPRLKSPKPSSSIMAADTFESPFLQDGVRHGRNRASNHSELQEHKFRGIPNPPEALSPSSSASSSTGNQYSYPPRSPSSPATSSTAMPTSAKPSYPASLSTTSLSSVSRRRGHSTTSHHSPFTSTASLALNPSPESRSSSPIRKYQQRNLGIGLPSSSSPLSPRSRDADTPGRRSLDSPTTSPRRTLTHVRHGTDYSRPSVTVSEYGEIRGRGSLDLEPSPRIITSKSSTSRPSTFETRRQRKRSMSMEEHNLSMSVGRYAGSRLGTGLNGTATPGSSRVFDVRPSSSLSARHPDDSQSSGGGSKGRPMMEWLGPRTAKAFRAAGLLDADRDRERDRDEPPPFPSPGVEQVRRFGSVRSTTSRTQSRAEAGYGQRRGSGSYFSGASVVGMESPTYTVSSSRGEREWPPRSASTAPTSVSGLSNGREESAITALKEKHTIETEALLSALADSQRTTRILREENGELRERLQEAERLEDVVDDLRRQLGRIEEENDRLRRFVADSVMRESDSGEKEMDTQRRTRAFLSNKGSLGRHTGAVIASPLRQGIRAASPPSPPSPPTATKDSFDPEVTGAFIKDDINSNKKVLASTSTPAASHRRSRRFSTASSSIFPALPANMTMLNEENLAGNVDAGGYLSQSESDTSASHVKSIPWSMKGDHTRDTSILSISNFSMTTGSPGSLRLRPEHEVHLGDMDSLNLGAGTPLSGGSEDDGDW